MHLCFNLLCLISVNSKPAPPLVCSNEIVSPQCFIPRKTTKKKECPPYQAYARAKYEERAAFSSADFTFCLSRLQDVPLFFFFFFPLHPPDWTLRHQNGTQTYITAPEQHQCRPWTPRHNQIQCLTVHLKWFRVKENLDFSSLLCNCGGNESLRKSVHKFKKKKKYFVQRYIFYENTFVI